MRARAIVAGLSASLAVSVVSGQSPPQPPPTFKAEVEYVEVDTLVVDKDGNFVRNLTKEDFRIFEDGKPQKISAFTLVDIRNESVRPMEAASGSVDSDVQSNERSFDGRVYVVVLDDLHTQFSRTPRTQAAARQFIEHNLGADDLMAVVSTGARAQDAQAFTNNKRLLLAAVDAVLGQKMDSPTVSQNTGFGAATLPRPSGSRIADNDSIERVQRAQMALGTLRQVADWFGGVRGRRKTMLLFSEGLDFDFVSAGDVRAATVYRDFLDTLAATARANVSIYAIDPRGLGLVSDDAISLATLDGRSGFLTAPPAGAVNTVSASGPPA
jgi:VWFA-related protein